MTPKLRRFLDEARHATPYLVVDVDVVEANYRATLELAPALAARVRAGRREERFVGTANTRNFLRKPFGPGWALVGDAGYHKDPVTAQGISDAFRDAERLARAVDEGLAGRRSWPEALLDYDVAGERP